MLLPAGVKDGDGVGATTTATDPNGWGAAGVVLVVVVRVLGDERGTTTKDTDDDDVGRGVDMTVGRDVKDGLETADCCCVVESIWGGGAPGLVVAVVVAGVAVVVVVPPSNKGLVGGAVDDEVVGAVDTGEYDLVAAIEGAVPPPPTSRGSSGVRSGSGGTITVVSPFSRTNVSKPASWDSKYRACSSSRSRIRIKCSTLPRVQ